jgi:adenylosuccinate synthase
MGIKYADVIVDLQYGDTGKGKVAHCLANFDDYDIVLRYNGGSNAGHTVYHNGVKIVTHQVPIGVLKGIPSIIGPGCVVNVPKLREEVQMLNDAGIDTKNLLKIDKRAHVVTHDHIEEDSTDEKIGTTRQGIGPTYRDKYGRTGTRIETYQSMFTNDAFTIIDIYDAWFVNRHPYRILCEGAQGFHLDIDWGKYPYVTSSHCTVGSVCLNGIPPHNIRKIIGVMKAYETYVGNLTTYTNENDPTLQAIQRVGNEFGATTGRPRKVNWLNLDNVLMAMNVNGVTDLIINKADVLQEVDAFGLVHNDTLNKFTTFDLFKSYVDSVLGEQLRTQITWSFSPNSI